MSVVSICVGNNRSMTIKPFKPKNFPEHADISSLRVLKFGIDPTFDRLHLGHLSILSFLKRNIKKDITIILGTVTAQLGDPSGREKTRPILSSDQVLFNANAIKKQLKSIIPSARICTQETMDSLDLLKITSEFTVTKLMSRDGFQRRESVGAHELLVPILQAMDSVRHHTELEIGGEDQLFNFELTREVQKQHGQKPEACALFPVLLGSDGKKMSKSLGNCIWLDDPQIDQRILAVSDQVTDQWLPFFILKESDVPEDPRERKLFLIDRIKDLLSESLR